MVTKITLNLNKTLAEKAEKVAKESGKSLSSLVESLLVEITNSPSVSIIKPTPTDPDLLKQILNGEVPLSPKLKKLKGVLKGGKDLDYKKVIEEEIFKKYG